jgi:hypothetical protein
MSRRTYQVFGRANPQNLSQSLKVANSSDFTFDTLTDVSIVLSSIWTNVSFSFFIVPFVSIFQFLFFFLIQISKNPPVLIVHDFGPHLFNETATPVKLMRPSID